MFYSQLFGNSEEEEEDLQVKESDKENGKFFNERDGEICVRMNDIV